MCVACLLLSNVDHIAAGMYRSGEAARRVGAAVRTASDQRSFTDADVRRVPQPDSTSQRVRLGGGG